MAKGSLQRAATARTADGINGQNGRRHGLDGLYARMIKQKKTLASRSKAYIRSLWSDCIARKGAG